MPTLFTRFSAFPVYNLYYPDCCNDDECYIKDDMCLPGELV